MREEPGLIRGGTIAPVPAGFPAWAPNILDYRHSLVLATKRADAGDETLEICAHCLCEVDVDPQPHKPGCPGIGAPRASSARIADAFERRSLRLPGGGRPIAVEGRDLLDRMDRGEPVARLEERDPEAEAHPLDEVTFPSDEPPGAASETPAWEAGRSPSRSSNPDNDQEATVKDCKIDGCTNDASDAPKRGLYVGLCGQHRKEKGAAMAAARRGGTGGGNASRAKAVPGTADPEVASSVAQRLARLESRGAAQARPLNRRHRSAARQGARPARRGRAGVRLMLSSSRVRGFRATYRRPGATT